MSAGSVSPELTGRRLGERVDRVVTTVTLPAEIA